LFLNGIKLENVFIFVVAIGAAVFIVLPFFKKRFEETLQETDSQQSPIEQKLRWLNSEKESMYSALKEIDFDYSTGKLSKEDYDELEKRSKTQAVALLKEIDGIMDKTYILDLDEEIEKQIRVIRKSEITDNQEIEKEIIRVRQSRVLENSRSICSVCGKEHKLDDHFCSKCGTMLNV
jgi:rubrerythrin